MIQFIPWSESSAQGVAAEYEISSIRNVVTREDCVVNSVIKTALTSMSDLSSFNCVSLENLA